MRAFGRASLLLAACVFFSGMLAGQLPDLLYYRFNEGTANSTANHAQPGAGSQNPNFTATPTWVTPGKLGAAHRKGTTDLQTGYATNLGTGAWTIEFWLKDSTGFQSNICGDGTAGGFRVYIQNGFSFNFVAVEGGGLTMMGLGASGNGSWNHIAIVYDGAGTLKGYVDGALSVTSTGQTPNITGSLFRVGSFDGSTNMMTGDLDEFRLWSTARTAAEITANMNSEITGPKMTLHPPSHSAPQPVLISEVAEDPGTSTAEFIELTNVSDAAVSLGGWKLHYYSKAATTPTLSHTLGAASLSPGLTRVFADEQSTTPASNEWLGGAITDFQDSAVVLADASGNIVDVWVSGDKDTSLITGPAALGKAWVGPGVPNPAGGDTSQRRYAADSDSALDWEVPGGHTLGAVNDALSARFAAFIPIKLTELVLDGSKGIEVQNISASAVNTTGFVVAVSDSLVIADTANATTNTLGASMAAGAIVSWTDTGSNPWGSTINWASGQRGWAMIVDAKGNVIDFVAWLWTYANIASMTTSFSTFTGVRPGLQWRGNGLPALTGTGDWSRTGDVDFDGPGGWTAQAASLGTANTGLGTTTSPAPAKATLGGAGSYLAVVSQGEPFAIELLVSHDLPAAVTVQAAVTGGSITASQAGLHLGFPVTYGADGFISGLITGVGGIYGNVVLSVTATDTAASLTKQYTLTIEVRSQPTAILAPNSNFTGDVVAGFSITIDKNAPLSDANLLIDDDDGGPFNLLPVTGSCPGVASPSPLSNLTNQTLINWTGSPTDVGTFVFTVTLRDGITTNLDFTVTFIVVTPPAAVAPTGSALSWLASTGFSATVVVNVAAPTLSLEIDDEDGDLIDLTVAGPAAPGLTAPVSATGIAGPAIIGWTGTPTALGVYTWTLTLDDGNHTPLVFDVTITVKPPNSPPTAILQAGSIFTGSATAGFSVTVPGKIALTGATLELEDIDGDPIDITSVSGGTVAVTPPATATGLSSGTVIEWTGTPLVGGSFTFTVTITDGLSAPVNFDVTLNVNLGPTVALASGSSLNQTGVNTFTLDISGGTPLNSVTLQLNDNESNPIDIISVTGTAPGVTPPATAMGLSSGTVIEWTGTPTTDGDHVFNVSISDGITPSVDFTLTLKVTGSPLPPADGNSAKDNGGCTAGSPAGGSLPVWVLLLVLAAIVRLSRRFARK